MKGHKDSSGKFHPHNRSSGLTSIQLGTGKPSQKNWDSKRSRRKLRIKNQTDEERYKSNAKYLKKAQEFNLYKHLYYGQDRQTTKQIKNELYQNPHRYRRFVTS